MKRSSGKVGGGLVGGLSVGAGAGVWVGVCLSAPMMGGCIVPAAIGGMVESYKRTSTRTVEPEYLGLRGKTVAVVVASDPGIEAEHPVLTLRVTTEITARLADEKNDAGIGGYVPPQDVLRVLYNTPGWQAKTMTELGGLLGGVDAIVYVEITEYRLHEPGDAYLWNGLAAGSVSVFDLRSSVPNEPAFRTAVSVGFPDKKGVGPETFNMPTVNTALSKRFIDRASWPFYSHEEPYYPTY